MIIFTLRTDKPEAEIGLYDDQERLAYCIWPAHRQLAETIHQKIKDLLKANNKTLNDIESIAVYKGPGSFTGLRIGLSVANALAESLNVPIVAVTGDDWILTGVEGLNRGKNDQLALPKYGSSPHITKPKH